MKKQTDSQRRSEAWEKDKITREESKLALQAQSPIDENRQESKTIVSFKQLAKIATKPRDMFGGNAQWIKADDMFQPEYRDGLQSPPFVITKAFKYVSKTLGDRIGLEVVLSNKRCYNIGFPYNENDTKRMSILDHFAVDKTALIGPVCLQKLDLGKGNAYYDVVPYESDVAQTAPVEIPFEEIDFEYGDF